MTELGNDGFHAPPVGLQIRLVQGVDGLLQFVGEPGLINRPTRFPSFHQLFSDGVQVADVDGVEIRDELIRIHVLPQSFVVRRPPQAGSSRRERAETPGILSFPRYSVEGRTAYVFAVEYARNCWYIKFVAGRKT